MKTIVNAIGTLVLIACLLSWLDYADFRLCFGPVGGCGVKTSSWKA